MAWLRILLFLCVLDVTTSTSTNLTNSNAMSRINDKVQTAAKELSLMLDDTTQKQMQNKTELNGNSSLIKAKNAENEAQKQIQNKTEVNGNSSLIKAKNAENEVDRLSIIVHDMYEEQASMTTQIKDIKKALAVSVSKFDVQSDLTDEVTKLTKDIQDLKNALADSVSKSDVQKRRLDKFLNNHTQTKMDVKDEISELRTTVSENKDALVLADGMMWALNDKLQAMLKDMDTDILNLKNVQHEQRLKLNNPIQGKADMKKEILDLKNIQVDTEIDVNIKMHSHTL